MWNPKAPQIRRLFVAFSESQEAKIVLAFSVGNVALTLLATRLLTEWTIPSELGRYYVLMNLVLWLAMPGAAAYNVVLRYWIHAKLNGEARALVCKVAKVLGLAAVVAAMIAAGLAGLDLGVGRIALLGIWISGVGQSALQSLSSVQAAERRRVGAGVLALASTPVRILALALLAKTGLNGAQDLLLAHAAIVAFLAAILWWLVLSMAKESRTRRGPPTKTAVESKQLIRFASPYLVTGVLAQACSTVDRWRLAEVGGTGETAVFVLAVGLSLAAVGSVSTPILSYFQPQVAEAMGIGDVHAARRILRRLVLLTGALMGVAALAGGFVAPLASLVLFGEKYRSIQAILPWTVVGACAFTLAQAIACYPFAGGDSRMPNASLALSQIAYVAVLLLWSPDGQPAVSFGRAFAGAQIAYLGLALGSGIYWARRLARLPGRVVG